MNGKLKLASTIIVLWIINVCAQSSPLNTVPMRKACELSTIITLDSGLNPPPCDGQRENSIQTSTQATGSANQGARQDTGSFNIKHDPWALEIDRKTGIHVKLTWKGETVFENPKKLPTLGFAGSGKDVSSFNLKKHDWDEKTGTLILYLSSGHWNLRETVQFGAAGQADRISRSLDIVSDKPDIGQPDYITTVCFKNYFPQKGRYYFPATIIGDGRDTREIDEDTQAKRRFEGNDRIGDLSSLQVGQAVKSNVVVLPLICEQTPTRSFLFVADPRQYRAFQSFVGQDGYIMAECRVDCPGWAEKDIPRTGIGPMYIDMKAADAVTTLKNTFHDLCRDIGMTVPADRPASVFDAVVFHVYAGGIAFARQPRKNGFALTSGNWLPRIAKLGCNTLWVAPITDGNNPYEPHDFFAVHQFMGGLTGFQDMVSKAHSLNLCVWLDIVPHGGTPTCGQYRDHSIEAMAFNRDGSVNNGFCWDYRSLEWNNYLARVARYYIEECGIDGYRIDMPAGGPINWRRKGFPVADRVPAGIPEAYWRKEIARLGGGFFARPYNPDTMKNSMGKVVETIRREIRRHNPNGIALAETVEPVMAGIGDAIYNHVFRLTNFKLAELPPRDFVLGLSRLLNEQESSQLPDTIRLQVLESHDTPPAWHCLGFAATRAMHALVFWARGIPLIDSLGDVGYGYSLKRMIEVRQALPEMKCGSAEYGVAKPESVLSILRQYEDLTSVALINFSDKTVNAAIPAPLGCEGKVIYNAVTGQKLNAPEVCLKPWATAVITFRRPGGACPTPPFTAPADPVATKAGCSPKLTRNDGYLTVEAKYTLVVDRSNGLIKSFDGILGETDAIFSSRMPKLNAKVATEEKGDQVHITVESNLYSIKYICTSEEVRMESSLQTKVKGLRRAGMFLSSPEAERWQVNTVEGLMDDFFVKPELANTAKIVPAFGNRQHRSAHWSVFYESEIRPLDFNRPVIRVFRGKSAVEIEFSQTPINAMVFNEVADRPGWHLALYWKESGPLAAEFPECFAMTLRPASGQLTEQPAIYRSGNVELKNLSHSWQIDNGKYKVILSRAGGVMRKLMTGGRHILSDQELYTTSGFRANPPFYRASTSGDGASGTRVWRDGSILHMRFLSRLRPRAMHKDLDCIVWGLTEYAFDDSDNFRVSWSVLCENPPTKEKPFLAWGASLLPGTEIIGNGKTIVGLCDGQALFTISDITGASKFRTKGGHLDFVQVDEADTAIPLRKWLCNSMVITPGRAIPGKATAISAPTSPEYGDGEFDLYALSYSLKADSEIVFPELLGVPGIWIGGSSSMRFDTKNRCNEKTSVIFGGSGSFPGVLRIPLSKIPGGKKKISCMVKGEGLDKEPRMFTLAVSYVDRDGKLKDISKKFKLEKVFDWREIGFEMELPDDAAAPQVNIRYQADLLDPGHIWISDIKILTAEGTVI